MFGERGIVLYIYILIYMYIYTVYRVTQKMYTLFTLYFTCQSVYTFFGPLCIYDVKISVFTRSSIYTKWPTLYCIYIYIINILCLPQCIILQRNESVLSSPENNRQVNKLNFIHTKPLSQRWPPNTPRSTFHNARCMYLNNYVRARKRKAGQFILSVPNERSAVCSRLLVPLWRLKKLTYEAK
jgi:hypothetical protein